MQGPRTLRHDATADALHSQAQDPNIVLDVKGLARSITALGNTRWILDPDSKYLRARLLTPLESLSLMGFTGRHRIPEDEISEETAKEIAGNAVPVEMATKIAEGLRVYHNIDFMVKHMRQQEQNRIHLPGKHSCNYCPLVNTDIPATLEVEDEYTIKTTEEEQTMPTFDRAKSVLSRITGITNRNLCITARACNRSQQSCKTTRHQRNCTHHWRQAIKEDWRPNCLLAVANAHCGTNYVHNTSSMGKHSHNATQTD